MVNITKNCVFKNNTEYCTIVEVTVRSISAISVICAVIVLVLIFLLQRYKFVSQRLILYLVIATLLDAIEFTIGGLDLSESLACAVDGYIRMWFHWSLVVWVCNITANLFWNVVVGKVTNKYLEVSYIVVGIAVPVIFSIPPFVDNSYGPAGLWCWISNKRRVGQILRFVVWYIPIWVIIGVIFIVYMVIIVKLIWEVKKWDRYNAQNNKKKQTVRNEIKSLFLYPIFFLLVNIFPAVNRVQNAITPGHPVFPLYLLHAISTPLWGLGFIILFVVNKDTLRELKWSNFKTTLLTRFKRTGDVVEYDIEGKTLEIEQHAFERPVQAKKEDSESSN
eukprot:TRINITY_DN2652_c0_g3_i1.p1 TRINITY_DN2652_c0_g3~~TRINITY_DN2652_c0_g3_i1.p1  ORF type:complete len:334 (-),score=31.44 TRINITY_DN2652_c0_g3_i1:13-1014(-)